ncbi:MAG: GAF domain-containing protein, partial [Terriglobia bacterium]
MDEALKDNLDPIEALAAGTREECADATDEAGMINCLLRIAEELNATLDLDAVLQKVAERVKQFIDYDLFAIQLLDPLGQELRIRFGIGYAPEVVQHWRLGLGQGLAGTAAQSGKSVRVGDVTRDPRYIDAGGDIRAEMAIPLVVQNRTVGVLNVGTRQVDGFTESHERVLTFLAGHLANAIENSRLYENLRVQSRTLSLLHEMSRELTSILDRDKLLRKLAHLVKRLIDYQAFHLMLWDEERQELRDTLMLRYDERIDSKCAVPLGTGITGTAAALRQPVRVPNIHLDPRYVSAGDSIDVRSELAVPLVFKDRLIGVLDLESTEYNAFSEEHEQLLTTFASFIAIALENARLYEKVRKAEMRLERDLDTAREIQRGLLPDAPPRVPGLDIGFAYAPALQLGGDIYDFLPYADDRLALAVGDVAGKA